MNFTIKQLKRIIRASRLKNLDYRKVIKNATIIHEELMNRDVLYMYTFQEFIVVCEI